MNGLLLDVAETAAQNAAEGAGTGIILIIYVLFFGAFIYFLMVRPQKKEQKRVAAMHSDMEVGDTVLTTSGFYGVLIDIDDDVVIVEFGNNKNCRIPMDKNAIKQIEKANDGQ